MKIDLDDLVKAGGHWLELFDSSFAKNNIPLHARPILSAMQFVRDGIETLPFGESKKDFFEKEWFAALVIAVEEWYQDRYGAATFDPIRETFNGIVLMHGTPVKIKVPFTVSKVEVEGETCWLIFPDTIHESESWKSFFLTSPNFNAFSKNEYSKLEKSVVVIVGRVRRINLAINAGADLSDEVKQMAAGILGHIEKAVDDILTLKSAVAAIGCWELHLAIEKAFKVFLMQNGKCIKGHVLKDLSKASVEFGLEVTQSVLDKLPSASQAVNFRYGEDEVEISEAVDVYDAALQLIDEITSKLRREFSINNGGFLLKKPRWVGHGT